MERFKRPLLFITDLPCQFVFQYMAGFAVTGLGLAVIQWWVPALIAMALAVACLALMWFSTEYVREMPDAKPAITAVQFNVQFRNMAHQEIRQFLTDHHKEFDIVVLQETTAALVAVTDTLADFYPWQVKQPRANASGMTVLSRHPFLADSYTQMDGPAADNFCIRVVIQPPGMKAPVAIYAIHAMTPLRDYGTMQRNDELKAVAARAAQDQTPHKLMLGDWNVTPYSPGYRTARKAGGLAEQRTALLPLPTWHARYIPWLMQIPIDHIWNSRSLRLLRQYRGPASGSDHLPVIASFGERMP